MNGENEMDRVWKVCEMVAVVSATVLLVAMTSVVVVGVVEIVEWMVTGR